MLNRRQRNLNEISVLQLASLWSAAYLGLFTIADIALSAITTAMGTVTHPCTQIWTERQTDTHKHNAI